jgi:hypothetical protein
MKWALIGVPALALAGIGIDGLAAALPPSVPGAEVTAARSAPLLPVAHHRYYYRSRRAGDATSGASDSGGVKPGQWEFTTRLEAFAPQQLSGTQSPQASPALSGGDATYLSCIQSDRPVPFQFDGAVCKLDSRDHQGARITWSMTCTNQQGAVRSDGVAQYHGDTMDGTLINHFPAANGKLTDLTQRITGRYLGACPQMTEATPPRPTAPPATAANPASGSSAQWVEPPAAAGGAKPPPAASGGAASEPAKPSAASAREGATVATPREAATTAPARAPIAAPAEASPPPRTRYAHHRRHYSHRYYGYSGGGWAGGGLFGIRIPFLGGL